MNELPPVTCGGITPVNELPPVTCGGASMGPASGGPSSRRVMGGGVRRGGPCSRVGVMTVATSSPRVLVVVVVMAVVTVISVVSSAEVDV